jgi:hypothetical protein
MDVDELQHALGGGVLESAFLERVLRAAFSALIDSKYAAVVDSRLTAATMIEDCERITRYRTDIPGADRLADAANEVKAAMTAAVGPEWDLVEDQLRQELGRDVGADYRGQRPDE